MMKCSKIFMALAVVVGVATAATLEDNFLRPPAGCGVQTWWHWANPQVTRAGIQADLEGMGQVGYEVAHIFVPGMTAAAPVDTNLRKCDWPQMLEPEWREIYRFACEQAAANGVKLGVHNCPGWSSSGGPWIKPEESMQVIVPSEMVVEGGKPIAVELPMPEVRCGYYEDIAVLAFPNVNTTELPKVICEYEGENPQFAADGNPDTTLLLPIADPSASCSIRLEYQNPVEANFLKLHFNDKNVFIAGKVEYSVDGENYEKVLDWKFQSYNDAGDAKYLALPKTIKAKYFRIYFIANHLVGWEWMKLGDFNLREVSMLTSSMIANVGTKNSSGFSFGYQPDNSKLPGINPETMIDLTANTHDGKLTCDLPAGSWTILRLGHTSTGKTNGPATDRVKGLECDKLSRRGMDVHWKNCVDVLIKDAEPSGALEYITIDSYEVGGQNWTNGFDQEFYRLRGYDMAKYWPAVVGYVVGTPQESAKFLFDYQRTVADLFAVNYYDYFTELCHKAGKKSVLEAYGGPFGFLRCSRSADVPAGEFWILGAEPNRMPSSANNVNGRKGAGAESFTTDERGGKWLAEPEMLRYYGDRAMSNGISQIIVHSYVHQPYANVKPGHTLERHGSMLNRNVTWWPMGWSWTEYLHRTQYLLQHGAAASEALILSGESKPNDFGVDDKMAHSGYGYDFCCAEDIYEQLKVENGKIVAPSGAKYDVLHLGRDRYLSGATLRKVIELMEQGAVVSGLRPFDSPSLMDNPDDYQLLCEKLWGNLDGGEIRQIGAGRLVNVFSAADALALIGVKNAVELPPEVRVIHRTCEEGEIYWFWNSSDKSIAPELVFNYESLRLPEIWDACAGTVEAAPIWHRKLDRTFVTLEMCPHDSKFVIFRKKPSLPKSLVEYSYTPSLQTGIAANNPVKITNAIFCDKDNHQLSVDVTEAVAQYCDCEGLNISTVNGNVLKCGDPSPNHYKVLVVNYEINGKADSKVFAEHEPARIAAPAQEASMLFDMSSELPQPMFAEPGKCLMKYSDGSSYEYHAGNGDILESIDLNQDWDVTFPPNWGAPEQYHFNRLESWTKVDNAGINFFSGIGTYRKTVNVPKYYLTNNQKMILSLGEMKNVAEVRINGQLVGVLWMPPFNVDVTGFLREGDNDFEIKVANLWVNRLIGDARLPQDKCTIANGWPDWVLKDQPNSGGNRYTWAIWQKGWFAKDEPLPSGLIGPVVIKPYFLGK